MPRVPRSLNLQQEPHVSESVQFLPLGKQPIFVGGRSQADVTAASKSARKRHCKEFLRRPCGRRGNGVNSLWDLFRDLADVMWLGLTPRKGSEGRRRTADITATKSWVDPTL